MLLFSKKQFLQSRKNDDKLVSAVNSVCVGWPDIAEGLTEDEAERKSVYIISQWCVDVPDNFMELLQNEITAQLKNCKMREQENLTCLDKNYETFVTVIADLMNMPLSKANKDVLVMFTKNLINGGNENC